MRGQSFCGVYGLSYLYPWGVFAAWVEVRAECFFCVVCIYSHQWGVHAAEQKPRRARFTQCLLALVPAAMGKHPEFSVREKPQKPLIPDAPFPPPR